MTRWNLGRKSFAVQEQTVQYVQNKAETTESTFNTYRLDMNALLNNVNNIMRLLVHLRENRALAVPDEFLFPVHRQNQNMGLGS